MKYIACYMSYTSTRVRLTLANGGEILNFMALKHCYGKWDESCVTFGGPRGRCFWSFFSWNGYSSPSNHKGPGFLKPPTGHQSVLPPILLDDVARSSNLGWGSEKFQVYYNYNTKKQRFFSAFCQKTLSSWQPALDWDILGQND